MIREGSSHQVLSGRMRKRDIVRYYGKRMIRKVSEWIKYIPMDRLMVIT